MKNYRFHNEEYDSEFEDDGEQFRPQRNNGKITYLGEGTYDNARVFTSEQGNRVVSLQPKETDDSLSVRQARRKHAFFQALYPDKRVELFTNSNNPLDYRLVLPKLPGVELTNVLTPNIIKNSLNTRFDIAISLLRAIQEVHRKGLVIVDLSEKNILYHSGVFYPIDGGLSANINRPLNPNVFILESESDILNSRKRFYHIAPECWSTRAVCAAPSMDIFSVERILRKIFVHVENDQLSHMLSQCRGPAVTRPSLEEMITTLETIKKEKQKEAENDGILSKIISRLFWSSGKNDPSPDTERKPRHDYFGAVTKP
ncbi:serine/threonine-protein kinase [Legionella impletisoli]|uniref:Protein kinase domain-containing protein n=1 Tax=Legionella impletisoli TaxID=343510 RepID=A0A917JMT2_9GAMM|nr:serine/threonine-protein kinase [Legionella impletisoli]GGI75914.1 hypothetical protein GCM10007966_00950 [Legionella impletisoli]